MNKHVIRGTWLKLFVGIALLIPSFNALAHAKYERSDPGPRAIVTRPPEVVKIWFSERLESAYSTISVKDREGVSITEEAATLDTEDGKLIILKLPVLTPGKYTVFYKVLSVDGHIVESTFKFQVKQPKKTP